MTHLNLNSRRQRAISRRSLALLALAILLGIACARMPAWVWKADARTIETGAVGAPPEAATRPNPPTEPLRGPG